MSAPSSGVTGNFNSSTMAMPTQGVTRPSSGGIGGAAKFNVVDTTPGSSKMSDFTLGRGPVRIPPPGQLGKRDAMPGNFRSLIMTGAHALPGYTAGKFGGGVPDAVFSAMQRAIAGKRMRIDFPGSSPQIGVLDSGGQPIWAGMGTNAGGHPGIAMFRENLISPMSRTGNGLLFNGFASMPNGLLSHTAGGTPNADPSQPPGVFGGAGGSPLVRMLQASRESYTSMTESKMSFEVNVTIPHALTIRPTGPGFNKATSTGEIIFVNRSTASLEYGDTQRDGFAPSRNNANPEFRYTTLTMTQLNCVLAMSELHPATVADECSCADISSQYEAHGITINDEPLTLSANPERILNAGVAGEVTSAGYWGDAVKGGDSLWVILRRESRAHLAEMSSANYGKGSDTIQYIVGKGVSPMNVDPVNRFGEKLHERPFQFVPYATRSGAEIPLSELEYVRLDGSTAFGTAIHIGYYRDVFSGGGGEGTALNNPMACMVDVNALYSARQYRVDVVIYTQNN